jgi:C4-dicarboxylate transporter, DctQ subunit
MLNLLQSIDALVGRAERLAMIFLTSLLTLILCAQVILRYFFNSPLFWAEEVSVQILIMISFMGVSYLTWSGQLVRVDLLLSMLKPASAKMLMLLLNAMGLVSLLALTYYATEWISRPEIRTDVSPTTQLPRWYNYAVLVFSFYCMTLHQAVKLILPSSGPEASA